MVRLFGYDFTDGFDISSVYVFPVDPSKVIGKNVEYLYFLSLPLSKFSHYSVAFSLIAYVGEDAVDHIRLCILFKNFLFEALFTNIFLSLAI